MVAFAERLAKDKKATLPSGYAKDFEICRRFLDQRGASVAFFRPFTDVVGIDGVALGLRHRLDRSDRDFLAGVEQAGAAASLVHLAVHPPAAFLRNYLAKGGFRDGTTGFVISRMNAYYVFLKFAKLWEPQRQ